MRAKASVREQKALGEAVRLTGIAPDDGEPLAECLKRIAKSHPAIFLENLLTLPEEHAD